MTRRAVRWSVIVAALMQASAGNAANPGQGTAPTVAASTVFTIRPLATLTYPWSMAFLPNNALLIVEKPGALRMRTSGGKLSGPIPGVPTVVYAGQGGLLDVAIHPDFASNRLVYLSFAEGGPDGTSGLAVGRGRYVNGKIVGFVTIWRQTPKLAGSGQFGGRLAFAADKTLFVSAGDRVAIGYVQSLDTTIGKIVHLNDDGTPAAGNPWAGPDPVRASIWSVGHRNPYGLAFDAAGRLWEHENGPQGGDEINLISKAANYGWPLVSNGNNYDGSNIPDHDTRPDFAAPSVWWNPSLAPAGLIFYSGKQFPAFAGNAFVGMLAGQALVRVTVNGVNASETVRYAMGARIRDVEQGPDGAIYVLEDGPSGRLLKLSRR